uniref:Peptidase S1 domain-containing protein n=1 Tax=Glossina palpalis gambiensis TaxID=67801 RepID=A0A1B0BWR8_9MUSC
MLDGSKHTSASNKEGGDSIALSLKCRSYDSVPSLQSLLGEGCHYKSFIVDRVKAGIKEFPFVALIYRKDRNMFTQFCAGTLSSKEYALISAHCFLYGTLTVNSSGIMSPTTRNNVCGTKNDPSAYNRVKLYTNWIQRIIWD